MLHANRERRARAKQPLPATTARSRLPDPRQGAKTAVTRRRPRSPRLNRVEAAPAPLEPLGPRHRPGPDGSSAGAAGPNPPAQAPHADAVQQRSLPHPRPRSASARREATLRQLFAAAPEADASDSASPQPSSPSRHAQHGGRLPAAGAAGRPRFRGTQHGVPAASGFSSPGHRQTQDGAESPGAELAARREGRWAAERRRGRPPPLGDGAALGGGLPAGAVRGGGRREPGNGPGAGGGRAGAAAGRIATWQPLPVVKVCGSRGSGAVSQLLLRSAPVPRVPVCGASAAGSPGTVPRSAPGELLRHLTATAAAASL